MARGWHKTGQKVAFSGAKMSKKGGGAGDGKITPKNPSLRMRPRGGVFGVARGGAEIVVFGCFRGWQESSGFWECMKMHSVAFRRKRPKVSGLLAQPNLQ